MSDLIYYQRNRDVTLNRAKGYYQNNKERLREQASTETYLKKTKTKRENMGKTDISEEKKQRLKEYQKNYDEAKMSQCNN